jgi:hypothetical protein
MLTRGERIEVIDGLSDHVGLDGSIGALITVVFQGPDRAELGSLPLDLNTVPDQAAWLVDSCLASRWHRNPSLLELLLTRLVVRGGKGSLQTLLTRVQSGVDPNPDPYMSLWVLADQPFLDRESLRTAAKQLIEDVARPILRVNGPKSSGKSYTVELLSYVMHQARPDIHVVPLQLADGTGPSFEVEELAESLVLSMEKTESLPQRSNSSYPAALSRWLIRNVNRNPGIWIFALDGFGQPNVKQEVFEMIHQMAQQVRAPEFARKMRLVLLHFDQPLQGNWRARTLDDGLTVGTITQKHLEDCLTEFNRRMAMLGKTSKMVQPTEIQTLAAGMLDRCGSADFSQLPGLYDQLLALSQ